MTALKHAQTYAAIFISATRQGKDWRDYRPVDSTLKGNVIEIGGVRMEPAGDGWMLWEKTAGKHVTTVRPAEKKEEVA